MERPQDQERALAAGAGTGMVVAQGELHTAAAGTTLTAAAVDGLNLQNRGRAFVAGQIIAARYRIERPIKSGGMGEVYLAYDIKLDQQIALKTIRGKIAGNPQALLRFHREIVTARAVTHPNVCRVFDLGEEHNPRSGKTVHFLTMEYLPGETLTERLRRKGKLSIEEALAVVRQIIMGLDAAHRAGVIHRDLKPSNVILTQDHEGAERAVVTDFGLARPVDKEDSLTRVGQAVGTPNYMAPEQWKGEETTPATDIYALGIVLHEMVTGKRPAQSAGEEALNKRWAQVIRHCLSPEPQARPQRAIEVLEALEGEPPGWLTWRVAAMMACVVALAAMMAGLFGGGLFRAAGLGQKRVTVLPFRADDEQLRPFADGLMEAITQRLSQYEGQNVELLITPASETRRSNINSPSDAKSKLGANLAIEGSLHSEQGRLRLLLAVIDTEKVKQLETTIVEGTRLRALAVQDEAVARLVEALELRTKAGRYGEQLAMAPGAHELYLSGRGYLRRNDQLASVQQAVGLFRKAVEMDPKNARVHAGLSEAIWREFERTNNRDLVEPALRECREAMGLNDKAPEVNISCGQVMAGTGKAQEALKHFQKALMFEPRSGEAMEGLGRAHEALKDLAKAEAAFKDMVRLRNGDWQAYKQLGLYYYRRERFDDAAAQFRRVVELTPDNAQGYSNLGVMYAQAGKLEEARKALERSHKIEPRHSNLQNLGRLLSFQGKYAEAAIYHRQAAEARPESHLLWGNLAAVYDLGKDARARQTYERAIDLAKKDLKVNPADTLLYVYLAHYHAFLDSNVTDDWFSKALRVEPIPARLVAWNAMTARRLGHIEMSRQLLARALKAGFSRQEAEANPYFKNLIDSQHP
jgi:serine/threonine-protein kinase